MTSLIVVRMLTYRTNYKMAIGKKGRSNNEVCKLIIMMELCELRYKNKSKMRMEKGRRNNIQVSILNPISNKIRIIIILVLPMFMKMSWEM